MGFLFFMPYKCINIHIYGICFVDFRLYILNRANSDGQFSQNAKNIWIFMQKGVDIYAVRAYSMHCQGGTPQIQSHLYTARRII